MSTPAIRIEIDNEWLREAIEKMKHSLAFAYDTQNFRVMPTQGERCIRSVIHDHIQTVAEPVLREFASQTLTQIGLKNLQVWIDEVEEKSSPVLLEGGML